MSLLDDNQAAGIIVAAGVVILGAAVLTIAPSLTYLAKKRSHRIVADTSNKDIVDINVDEHGSSAVENKNTKQLAKEMATDVSKKEENKSRIVDVDEVSALRYGADCAKDCCRGDEEGSKASTSKGSSSTASEDSNSRASTSPPKTETTSMYMLAFHQTLFENVPWTNQILFILWILIFGPLVFLVRCFVLFLTAKVARAKGCFESELIMRHVLGFRIKVCESHGQFEDSDRPIVFLTNHHLTWDIAFVRYAAYTKFGLQPKVVVHKKVFDGPFMGKFGSLRDKLMITSKDSKSRFPDIFAEWAVNPHRVEGTDRPSLLVAPAGMTTHSSMITPMYWEYYANERTSKIIVNVDHDTPFGANLRNLRSSSVVAEVLTFIMPWINAKVTFHHGAVPEGEGNAIRCQSEVDKLVADIYKKHHNKEFAPSWTQKRRRKLDKYFHQGQYVPLTIDPSAPVTETLSVTPNAVESDLRLPCGELAELPEHLLRALPPQVRFVTNALSHNKRAACFAPEEIALVNPKTSADELLAAAFDIPMTKDAHLDEGNINSNSSEARITIWLQERCSAFTSLSKLLHYVFVERNLILLGTLLLSAGTWTPQLLIVAQMATLVQVPLLVFKLWVNRPRPVWLPLAIPLKSLVGEIQMDSSFPSGHSSFFSLLATVSFWEPNLFSLQTQLIFVLLAVVGAIGRVHVGAHYLTDVVCGSIYAVAFVSIFYMSGADDLLFAGTTGRNEAYEELFTYDDDIEGVPEWAPMRFPTESDYNYNVRFIAAAEPSTRDNFLRISDDELTRMTRFTLILTVLQLFAVVVSSWFRPVPSPLDRDTFFRSNLARLPGSRGGSEKASVDDQLHHRPCGPSFDFLSPFISLSACAFWVHPLMVRIYAKGGYLPFTGEDIPGVVRFFGALLGFSFTVAVVLPSRGFLGRYLKKGHLTRFFSLILLYMSVNIFATLFCHFAIQAVMTLKAPSPCEGCRVGAVNLRTGVTLEYAEIGNKVEGSSADSIKVTAPIIFLPGYVNTWQSFGKLMEKLPLNEIHAFAPSLRGHGESDKPEDGYDMSDFMEDVVAFMDELQIKSATIVGHSFGGVIAQRLAIEHPERVSHLCLVATSGNPDPVTNGNLRILLEETVNLKDPMDKYKSLGFKLEFFSLQEDVYIKNIAARETAKTPARVWQQVGLTMALTNNLEDLAAHNVSMNIPSFIAWGTADEAFGESDQLDLIASLPDARVKYYQGANHELPWEVSSLLAKDIVDFARYN